MKEKWHAEWEAWRQQAALQALAAQPALAAEIERRVRAGAPS